GEAETAEAVVGRAGGNRVRLAAPFFDLRERPLPALLEADAEAGVDEADVGAHQPAQLDVPHAVVDDVGPVDPAFLDQHALHAGARSGRSDLSGVIRLHAADRHKRVATLRQRVGHQVLELPGLVAAVCQPTVAV